MRAGELSRYLNFNPAGKIVQAHPMTRCLNSGQSSGRLSEFNSADSLKLRKKSANEVKFSPPSPITLPGKLRSLPGKLRSRFRQGGPMASIASVLSTTPPTAAAVSELMVDVRFSTTIAGIAYNADVTYSAGEYIAADPGLSGAVATGNSLVTAEDNLTTRIDALV
jgi:hypothetical protein